MNFNSSIYSQIYNTLVEAKLDLDIQDAILDVKGSAFNKTEISQSLEYVFSIFNKDSVSGEPVKTSRSDRFILEPLEKKQLVETSVKIERSNETILLLLIYDMDKNIIGNARIEVNKWLEEQRGKLQEGSFALISRDVSSSRDDGLVLRGIVVEDSKTKSGSDFYKLFYTAYNLNTINAREIVKVSETFGLGMTTRIEVLVNDEVLFSFFARPNDIEYLKKMSDLAIRRTIAHFQNKKNQAETIKKY